MATILSVIALAGTVAGGIMWIVNTCRHRSHLSQCVQDLQRHHRLDRRLIGCVNDRDGTHTGRHSSSRFRRRDPGRTGRPRSLSVGLRQEAVAVTSNLHPSGFDTIMPKTLATATVDRLLHHAHVVLTEDTWLRLSEATAGRGVMPLTRHPRVISSPRTGR
jgi:hypothetical protein